MFVVLTVKIENVEEIVQEMAEQMYESRSENNVFILQF